MVEAEAEMRLAERAQTSEKPWKSIPLMSVYFLHGHEETPLSISVGVLNKVWNINFVTIME